MSGGRPSLHVVLAGAAVAVLLGGAAAAGALALGGGPPGRPPKAPVRTAPTVARPPAPSPQAGLAGAGGAEAASPPASSAPAPAPPAPRPAPTDLPLPGCPPPPYTGPPAGPPWHPAHLVPDSQLPPPPAPTPGRNPVAAIGGKGMWVWQLGATDHGDVGAIVSDAVTAGLRQIWVRVADSKDGFYGGPVLDRLVPAAHRAGLAVIGWGFPYLFDPVADAGWTQAAIGWRTSDGQHLDGWSADLETSSEGVALSPQRVALYLGRVRAAAPHFLLIATVFPPTDQQMRKYPFGTMAPYLDAFAPMLYWGCTQPVLAVQQAMARLRPLGPEVHVIGQAYDMGPYGGRRGAPPGSELDAFMLGARQSGAVGASFWSWQSIDPEEWSAVSRFRW